MTKEAIIAALKTIIKPYSEETIVLETLSENTDFIKDLKINSANLVDIVLDVEEKFGIEIDNDSMAKMLTVQATIDVIQSKLGNNAGE
ncbi:MAG: acyl carrier protein [Chryseobacterium sp.]|uniref:Phosphopantetheine-binding protein n=1 Tax=Pedobacter agri TaxID=454586 RepID=A0A9X3DD69_9SPHI|nr:phosphopantetheine-binding protein [Pedobacter agri]MCX3263901.1 phosphopantetheine-binding protein [Pedobacter agri]MDQ1141654.1 acyl carrier protein [Pedobacter agri]RZJ88445.1 MAG: acyl carrier protein [Chryseobacterium sp.]